MPKPTRHINIFELMPRLWFENENGDRQIPPTEIQDNPDALDSVSGHSGGFIFQHVLVHSVVGHDVVTKDPNTGELRHIRRDFLPFDHKLVEGLVRKGDFDLRSAMLLAIEACERCVMALRFRYKLGPGYDFDDPLFEGNPARCRICYEPDPDTEPPEWFTAARALIAAATPPEESA